MTLTKTSPNTTGSSNAVTKPEQHTTRLIQVLICSVTILFGISIALTATLTWHIVKSDQTIAQLNTDIVKLITVDERPNTTGLRLNVLTLTLDNEIDVPHGGILMFTRLEDEQGADFNLVEDPGLSNFDFVDHAYIVEATAHYQINLRFTVAASFEFTGATGDFDVVRERGGAEVELGSLQALPTVPPHTNQLIFSAIRLELGDKIFVRESGPDKGGGTKVTMATFEVCKIGS